MLGLIMIVFFLEDSYAKTFGLLFPDNENEPPVTYSPACEALLSSTFPSPAIPSKFSSFIHICSL